jgi:hypothetical protein
MIDGFKFAREEWVFEHDSYLHELENFQRDAYILIHSSLHTGINALTAEGDAADAELTPYLESAKGEHHEFLVDRQVSSWMDINDQQTFLRNMALVALLSRLIHALTSLAKSAQGFSPRKKCKGMGDFGNLWCEFRTRFSIDLVEDEKGKIEFIDPLRRARNIVVHAGGEVYKPGVFIGMDTSEIEKEAFDLTFFQDCPHLVEDEGMSGSVHITQQILDEATESSINLVRWLAGQLRQKELIWLIQQRALAAPPDWNSDRNS